MSVTALSVKTLALSQGINLKMHGDWSDLQGGKRKENSCYITLTACDAAPLKLHIRATLFLKPENEV